MARGGEDAPPGENRGGLGAQRFVFDQFQPQQRGEDAERIDVQRRLIDDGRKQVECTGTPATERS